MRLGLSTAHFAGAALIAAGAVFTAPAVVRFTATAPISEVATSIGHLLVRYSFSGPIGQYLQTDTQSVGGPEYFLFPAVRWLASDDVARLIATWAGLLGICALGLWMWSRLGIPARTITTDERRVFAFMVLRTVFSVSIWAVAVSIADSQLRLILVIWHNNVMPYTWQLYTEGYVFREAREVRIQDFGATALFIGGAMLITRAEIARALPIARTPESTGSCPFCGYSTGDLEKCPECGRASDGSQPRVLYFTRVHARLAQSWWIIPVRIVVCALIVGAMAAPLTHGLLWIALKKLGI